MTLGELLEAHLRGESPEVPAALREEFDLARAAYEALDYALGESLLAADGGPDRARPELPEDYELLDEIGRGGMGVVYRARQRSLGRDVAVKVLRPGDLAFGPMIRRFLDEARHLARLRHPNIVAIHEAGEANGEPFFSMDLVDGVPLSHELRGGPIAPARTLAILGQVADGVAHAHAHGIIHRDLKPANVLLDAGGKVFVTDFGLSRDMSRVSDRTQSGQLIGTPAYMAPEQALGQSDQVGEATDVHGLGVLMYEMLTGRPPYGNDAPAQVLARLLHEEPAPPRRFDRRIPRTLEVICCKAMAKRPEQRYPSVAALRSDLRRFAAGESIVARPRSALARGATWVGRRWRGAALIGATAALVGGAVWWMQESPVQGLLERAARYRDDGHPGRAIDFYREAFAAADPEQRAPIVAAMVEAVARIDEPKPALAAAERVLECAPDASLGGLDYAVAMTQVSRLDARTFGPGPHDDLHSMCRAAVSRLEIFLAGDAGSERERDTAERAHTRLRSMLTKEWLRDGQGAPIGYTIPDAENKLSDFQKDLVAKALVETILPRIERRERDPRKHVILPEGEASELEAASRFPGTDCWERGKAAYAAGLAHERDGRSDAAASAFAQAFELLRQEFPVYAWGPGYRAAIDREPGPEPAAAACAALLTDAAAALRRLEPARPDPLRGGVRFVLDGPPLPEGLLLLVVRPLRNPGAESIDNVLPAQYSNAVFGADGTAWLGIADGAYRPTIGMVQTQTSNAAAARFADLLVLEEDWPEQIEIRGDTIELRLRLRTTLDVVLEQPADAALVDLENDVFRWAPVAGAAEYRVVFERRPTASASIAEPALVVRTNALCVGTLEDRAHVDWPAFTAGTRVDWSVAAFDNAGQQIGTCRQERSFLVSRGVKTR